MFFEARDRRALPRPSARLVAALGLIAAAALAAGLLLARDPPPAPPEPLAAARAEQRLESRLALDAYGTGASVRCNGPVREASATRCHVLYADGDTQLLLVGLSRAGKLDVQVPYPAQRRPGG